MLVLRTDTGQVAGTDFYGGEGPDVLYWVGGDTIKAFVVGEAYICYPSFECGRQYGVDGQWTIWPEGQVDYFEGQVAAVLREGLVVEYTPPRNDAVVPTHLALLGTFNNGLSDVEVMLPRMPADAPFGVVGDVARSRVFAISSDGLVAEIDRIKDVDRGPRVRYHQVDLNGRPFQAAWAGANRIALWGEDGLGTIDTRTWTTHAIAAHVTNAITTPFGIAAWTDNPADGVTVYRPDGTQRLRVLAGKRIKTAQAVGDYLYADTVKHARYSVNLRTGEVIRTLRQDATILVPDIVAIP